VLIRQFSGVLFSLEWENKSGRVCMLVGSNAILRITAKSVQFYKIGCLGMQCGNLGERWESKRPVIKLIAGASRWAPRLGGRSKIDHG